MLPPVHCSGGGIMMILLILLCSDLCRVFKPFSKMKLPPVSDIFLGNLYPEMITLHVNIKLSADKISVFLMTGNLL